MVTENELVQQRIDDHLAKIAAAVGRMADAMETLTNSGGINHRQIREPPPPYNMSTNTVNNPRRPWLQDPVHDRIDAIERDNWTLQIALDIAITGIAICYIYSEAGGIPLPLLLLMLLALAVGYAVSRRS